MAEVVGVVRDGKFRGYREQINPCFYVPLSQRYVRWLNLEVRTAVDPTSVSAAVRHEIQALDRDLPVPDTQTLSSFRDASLGRERLSAALLGALGVLAVLIAAIGLYGVLAFTVAQQTREIGVRMALGAAAGKVLGDVIRDALTLIGVGVALGCAAAVFLGRLVTSLLYGVSATDPLIYVSAAAVLIAVGVVAAFLPARRASRVDPVVALRYE